VTPSQKAIDDVSTIPENLDRDDTGKSSFDFGKGENVSGCFLQPPLLASQLNSPAKEIVKEMHVVLGGTSFVDEFFPTPPKFIEIGKQAIHLNAIPTGKPIDKPRGEIATELFAAHLEQFWTIHDTQLLTGHYRRDAPKDSPQEGRPGTGRPPYHDGAIRRHVAHADRRSVTSL
jgi:hypothetical protein